MNTPAGEMSKTGETRENPFTGWRWISYRSLLTYSMAVMDNHNCFMKQLLSELFHDSLVKILGTGHVISRQNSLNRCK